MTCLYELWFARAHNKHRASYSQECEWLTDNSRLWFLCILSKRRSHWKCSVQAGRAACSPSPHRTEHLADKSCGFLPPDGKKPCRQVSQMHYVVYSVGAKVTECVCTCAFMYVYLSVFACEHASVCGCAQCTVCKCVRAVWVIMVVWVRVHVCVCVCVCVLQCCYNAVNLFVFSPVFWHSCPVYVIIIE